MAVLALTGAVSKKIVDVRYLFDIVDNDNLQADADITDHYVENNTSVQDHMSIKPLTFTLSGFVSEQVFVRGLNTDLVVNRVINKLAPISALIPPISSYAATVSNTANLIEDSTNRYKSQLKDIKDLFSKDKTNQFRQEQVAQNLINIRDARLLVTLDTPFGFFENFLIKSISLEQGDTLYQTKLTVTVKEYKQVGTILTNVDKSKYASRLASQKAIKQDLGKISGQEELTSTLYRSIFGG